MSAAPQTPGQPRLTDVKTLLSSGNVVFGAKAAAESAIERRVERAMEKGMHRSFLTVARPEGGPRRRQGSCPGDPAQPRARGIRLMTCRDR